MSRNQPIRRLMPSFAFAPRRVAFAGAAALVAIALGACKSSEILNVQQPDILSPAVFNTPTGTDPLRFGVISDFTLGFDGNTDSYTTMSGDMADEIVATDTFAERLSINQLTPFEVNSSVSNVYGNLQQAHLGATKAATVLGTAQPTQKWQRGEMYMLRGFTEIFFGEGFCSGTPFSTADDQGNITYGTPNTTADLFNRAVASFDSALALADTSQRVKYGSQIGRARALLNLGRFADAATAATGIPRTFQLLTYHSTATSREENGMWNAAANGSSRYSVITKEGGTGLPYLSTPDVRISWAPSTRIGFNSISTNLPTETKFARTSNGIVGDGTEAQLMILEARLQGGAQADRDAVFAGLNALRTSNSPTIAAIAGSAPTTQNAAVDQFFQERAYWTWLTGHRLGDMRRLIRQYGRAMNTVFPTGLVANSGVPSVTAALSGSYGTATSMLIPFNERNNPNFTGCLDTKP
jgi:starch-binding outer membrane protein, SusD/RagB family